MPTAKARVKSAGGEWSWLCPALMVQRLASSVRRKQSCNSITSRLAAGLPESLPRNFADMVRTSISLAALIAALASQPALAADVAADANVDAATAADASAGSADSAGTDKHEESVVVTGSRKKTDVLGGVTALEPEELAHDLKPSLGDTLADLPGVSSSSFGPSSSRPILRGEQGERAPVLVDGISSLDLSASDPDHAVTINPLTAERIEVLHGPGALAYAPSAVGGVVNVIDTRIPRTLPPHM